ncbi:DNA polymerase III subunit [Marinigracilibium pacificum]|uniref:DNA polymerase III subunit delta n=1 Tax=Marinigracilibium pacificum TaxID=2729599 RepID=A0A848J3R1_9BACT|nr:DNA polymerase III subunit delta' [Marinigracilibium pacificum]NMM50361.1 DNA polymerase III subunit delta' [Marinigracilibium pacificum]
MQFSDIPGFKEEKEALTNAVKNNHLAHAHMFAGKQGGANLALAIAFGQFINCENPSETDSCGTCASCRQFTQFTHPDLHFIFPTGGTSKLASKDAVSSALMTEWRSFLKEYSYPVINDWAAFYGGQDKQLSISKEESRNIVRSLSLSTFGSGYKVMIIWLPEYLHPSAANAILKILEEPPGKTIFILVSCDLEAILPTILSRTQILTVSNFSEEELKGLLVEKGVEESQAIQLARLSDGNVSKALAYMDQADQDTHKLFQEWMRTCYKRDYSELVDWADKYQKLGKMNQKSLLEYGIHMMRESLIGISQAEDLYRLSGSERDFIENFQKVLNTKKIERVYELLNESLYHIERNVNARLMFLNLSLNLVKALR